MINSSKEIFYLILKAAKGSRKAGAKYYARKLLPNGKWKYWYTKASYDKDHGHLSHEERKKQGHEHNPDHHEADRIEINIQHVSSALNEIANGKDQATVTNLRPDLKNFGGSSDVSFIWGDDKKGLKHIGIKRGAQVVHEIIATVMTGKISRYVETKKTVILERDGFEAVLSLDEHGKKKTWLLTGWEKNLPDVPGEVSAQTGTTQDRPIFSRSDLVAGIDNNIRTFDKIVKVKSEKSETAQNSEPVAQGTFANDYAKPDTLIDKVNSYLDDKQYKKKFKDVNERISGSVKETRAISKILSMADIEKMPAPLRNKIIKKDRVLEPLDVQKLIERTDSPGLVYMQIKLLESIRSAPESTRPAQDEYVSFLPIIENYIKNASSIDQLNDIREMFETSPYMFGVYASGEAIKQYEENNDKEELRTRLNSLYPGAAELLFNREYTKLNKLVREPLLFKKGSDRNVSMQAVLGDRFINLLYRKTNAAKSIWNEALLREPLSNDIADARFSQHLENLQKYNIRRVNTYDEEIRRLQDLYRIQSAQRGRESIQDEIDRNEKLKAKYTAVIDRIKSDPESFREEFYTLRPEYRPRDADWSGLGEKKKTGERGKKEKPKKYNIFGEEIADVGILKKIPLKHIVREGGRPVTAEEVSNNGLTEHFGFKSLQIGNSMPDNEVKEHLKHLAGAMKDYEDVTGIPWSTIVRKGGLSLAIGARGKGGKEAASAHYEPGFKIINLTRRNGDGSIAHEMAHYLDNYLSETGSLTRNPKASKNPVIGKKMSEVMDAIKNGDYTIEKTFTPGYKHPVIPELSDSGKEFWKRIIAKYGISRLREIADNYMNRKSKTRKGDIPYNWKAIQIYQLIADTTNESFKVAHNTGRTKFYHDALSCEKNSYYSDPAELFARAFEAYTQDSLKNKGMINNYLVNGASAIGSTEWEAYPAGEERKRINNALHQLSQVIAEQENRKQYTDNSKNDSKSQEVKDEVEQ